MNDLQPASEQARAACCRAASDVLEELASLAGLLEGDRPLAAVAVAQMWDALQRALVLLRDASLRLRQ